MLNIWASQQQGGVPPPPDSIAITLLTSDTYSIGGTPKTFAECYNHDYTPNDSATVAIVADEGLSVDFTGGGTATSASGTLTATAALETALNPNVGFTGVIDVTPVFSDPSEQVFLTAFISTGPAAVGFDLRPKSGGGQRIAITDHSSGVDVFTDVVPTVVSGQKYRMAFSVRPNLLMLSVNGSDAVSRVPSVTLDFSGHFLKLYAAIFNAVAGSSARIGDARYYPLVTDSNVLRGMSA